MVLFKGRNIPSLLNEKFIRESKNEVNAKELSSASGLVTGNFQLYMQEYFYPFVGKKSL